MQKEYTVGIDLGGTNTACAIVDRSGKIVDSDSFPTASASIEQWADRLAGSVVKMAEACGISDQIIGIGVGAPCANATTGCIEAATDLPWPSPIPLAGLLESRFALPVTVTNDANAAAIGERTYGAAKDVDNFIVLTLGTGVGSGVVCDGHLLSGTRGFAGELGHVTFPFASGRLCGCGRYGCLQTVASGKGIVNTAVEMLRSSDRDSILRKVNPSALDPKIIEQAAMKGDPLACRVYEFTGECLGRAAAEFAAFTDPELIILYGGVAKAGELLLSPMRRAFDNAALHLYAGRVRFITSTLPEAEAALLGAASLPYCNK